jgi:acetoin utilization deacetylase AcuC-like enzyme
VVSQDVHHGNGTEEIAQDFPNLFFASVSATALLGCGWEPLLLRSVSHPALVYFCPIHRFPSISFTRAQGIPKYKQGFGRGKGWESWGKIG